MPEVWELIQEHQARCDCAKVARLLAELGAGQEAAGDVLFEALHFDHYLRQMLIDDWDLTPAATEFLLGRPLSRIPGDPRRPRHPHPGGGLFPGAAPGTGLNCGRRG